VTGGAGCQPAAEALIFRKILRASYRWRESGHGVGGTLLRLGNDAARKLLVRHRPPAASVEFRQVERFGAEVDSILDDVGTRVVLTDRGSAQLNHLLAFPRLGMSGWHVVSGGTVRGFAVLNVAPPGPTRAGKIVECLVEGDDREVRHAALLALAGPLIDQGADYAIGFGSDPSSVEVFHRAGFAETGRLVLTIRDRGERIPAGAVFHLSPFEADNPYT
jgi:hypothetical protein